LTRSSPRASKVVHHPSFGPAMPDLNWVPAPRYILRRHRVMELLKDRAPCRVLDIGCGPGALISELSELGFDVYGVDGSEKARALGRHLQDRSAKMQLHAQLDEDWKGTFDLVLSFEVIEHIQDDVGALREWRQYLKPGGRIMLSTPAHPSRWNAADEWAGHVRRYDRQELIEAFERAGFEIERVECYGFPLANVMEVLRARAYGKMLSEKKQRFDADELTSESGSDRSVDTQFWRLYSGFVSATIIRLFCLIQRPFLRTGLGNGFIVTAKVA
jgi:SAM-dependent methyltransferase